MSPGRLAVHAAASYHWNRSRLQDSGAWRDGSISDCAAYYKAPWSFSAAGDQDAAARSLARIRSCHVLADGDISRTENEVLRRKHPFYPHAYIAIGAVRLGQTPVADQILGFLSRHRNDRLTAWGDRRDCGAIQRFDSVSTAAIGLAYLERGDLAQAGGAVEFLIRLLRIQPHPEEKFYSSVAADGSLLTSFDDPAATHDRCVRFARRFEVWSAVSFPLILLARYAGLTQEPAVRRAALAYLALLDRSPQAWNDISAGKIGLACALLYRLGGDPGHKTRALRAMRALVSRLDHDGGWHRADDGKGAGCGTMVYEVNLEFTLMMALVGRLLAERDGVAFVDPCQLENPGPLTRWISQSERALRRAVRVRTYRWHTTRLGQWLAAR